MRNIRLTKRNIVTGVVLGLALIAGGIALVLAQSNSTSNQTKSVESAISTTTSQPAQQSPTRNVSDSPIPSPPQAAAAPTVSRVPGALRSGDFRGLEGEETSGGVSIIQLGDTLSVVLADDFKVSPGPDLYIGFGDNETVDFSTLFTKLSSLSGRQNYKLPDDLDHKKYSQVFIYCKTYVHAFGVADLK